MRKKLIFPHPTPPLTFRASYTFFTPPDIPLNPPTIVTGNDGHPHVEDPSTLSPPHNVASPTPGTPPIALRKGTRHVNPIQRFVSYDPLARSHAIYLASISACREPNTFAEADPRWQAAMRAEIEAMEINKTWDLVPLPSGKQGLSVGL